MSVRRDGAPLTEPLPRPRAAGTWWRGAWLALLPVVPPLSALAFARLTRAREFGRASWLVLVFFALTQVLAALLAPQPLPSLALAVFRALFLCALLATGWQLRRPQALRPLLIGLAAVYLTALAASLWLHGEGALHQRLIHPYYTTVSLGLSATLGLWLLLDWREGPRWLRWPFGLLAAATLALSGSRGAVLALLVGLLCALLAGTRGVLRVLVAGGALLLALLIGGWLPDNPAGAGGDQLPAAFEHLSQLGLNGRDVYWDEVLGTVQTHLWGGVGPYQLGFFARTAQASCWQPIDASGLTTCPAWLAPLRSVSWVAHNAALHSLGESGLIGTAGLFALLGLIGSAAWRSRNPLLLAIFGGFGAMNLVDNVTAVPSLHLAEVFWMAGGMALRALPTAPAAASTALTLSRASLWGGGLLLALTVPLGLPTWLSTGVGLAPRPNLQLLALSAPRQLVANGPNTISLGLKLAPGTYRLRLRTCAQTCGVAAQRRIVSDGQWWGGIAAPKLGLGTRLELQVLSGQNSPWSARPLGVYRWQVGHEQVLTSDK